MGRPGPCGCGCALTAKTSKGFSCIEFATGMLGIELLPWQRWLLIHALELRPDGRFRFRTILVLVARQNGKTTLVEIKNLWKLFVLRVMLVIGTAQTLDYSEESWDKAVEIVESVPELAVEVAHVDKTNGKKALKLVGGGRWKVAAASRRGGRSLSADDVNLDELREHQNWLAWAAVTKTTMARRNAQIWAITNAGDEQSVVLNHLQDSGRAAVEDPGSADPTLGHFEWSAPDDVKCTCGWPGSRHTPGCRLWDRGAWAQANPSLGYTVSEEAIVSALNTDPEPVFRTEVLCQRVPTLRPIWSVIPQAAWTALCDPKSQVGEVVAFAADVTPERTVGTIAVAGKRDDGLLHVEVTRNADGILDHRPGTDWMVDRLVELRDRWGPCAIVVDPASPAGSLIADLEAKGVEVVKPSAREHAQACGALFDRVVRPKDAPPDWAPTLRHLGQESLSDALAGAAKRPLSDAWAWDRKATSEAKTTSPVDISPIVAVTLAAWGHATRAHLYANYDVALSVY